ncbi:hypothetical protein AB0D12_39425 [Streptomyces sp. NPDC048479]
MDLDSGTARIEKQRRES